MSGHSVSAAHEKIIGPLAGRGPASPNGHRQRAPEVIAENASDSIGSPRLPSRTSPPDPAENNWDAETPAPTQERVNAECSRPAAGFNGFAEFGHDRLGWTQRQRRRRSRCASSSARHQAARPGHRGPARSPGRPARRTVGGAAAAS